MTQSRIFWIQTSNSWKKVENIFFLKLIKKKIIETKQKVCILVLYFRETSLVPNLLCHIPFLSFSNFSSFCPFFLFLFFLLFSSSLFSSHHLSATQSVSTTKCSRTFVTESIEWRWMYSSYQLTSLILNSNGCADRFAQQVKLRTWVT